MTLRHPKYAVRATEDSEHAIVPGDLLADRYRIEAIIGEGSFAIVYLAHHEAIEGLRVAIKVLRPQFARDEALQSQFMHEAETIARLRNPHTVRVSDMGRLRDGRPYICMEYCVGLPLNYLVRLYGPQNDAMVAHIARGVLLSLREAHSLGIIHRDIKPSNILITHNPNAYNPLTRVLDFGIAHVLDTHAEPTEKAVGQFVFCTPNYAAPELLEGEITAGADLYALSLSLAELLEGAPIFKNDGYYAVAERQASPEPVPFGLLTRESSLFPLIAAAGRKNPAERLQSTDQMLEVLAVLTRDRPHDELRNWIKTPPVGCAQTRACALHRDPTSFLRCDRCPEEGCHVAIRAKPSTQIQQPLPPRLDLDEFQTLRREANHDVLPPFSLDAFGHTERVASPSLPSNSSETPHTPRTRLHAVVLIVEIILFAFILSVLFGAVPRC